VENAAAVKVKTACQKQDFYFFPQFLFILYSFETLYRQMFQKNHQSLLQKKFARVMFFTALRKAFGLAEFR